VERTKVGIMAAIVIGLFAFLLRFNTLGGALGGFDNDYFIYLVRADALLAGEQPLRDFADAELRGAWPALSYEASAWAQRLGGRTLLPEAYLSVGLITLGHVLVLLLALHVSRRWSVALLAVAVAVFTFPKHYNYIKVLALVLGVWSVRAVAVDPSMLRLALASLVTAAAVLFRHDLGLYLGGGVVAALVARDVARWQLAAKHVVIYGAFTALLLLPSILWVQRYVGVVDYLREAAATVAITRTRENLKLPPLDLSSPLAPETMELAGYLAFWAVPAMALFVVGARLKASGAARNEVATGIGLLVMTALAGMSFLRANLAERFGDAAPAMVLLAAWIAGTVPLWRSRLAGRAVVAVPVFLLLVSAGAAYVYSEVGRELDTSGLADGVSDTVRRYRTVREELGSVPPDTWNGIDASATLRAARYVAECTRPDDRVLALGPVHEVLVYGRRRFAAGQAMFKLSLYTSEAQQRRALARLDGQAVPVVIAETAELPEFRELYPLVAKFLGERYRDAGDILIDEEPRFRVFVTRDRPPVRTDPELGLPCFA
jgi:hypothetical protein